MKVRCLYNTATALPEPTIAHGCFERTVLHITPGKEYTVYGIVSYTFLPGSMPSIQCLIRDDLEDISNYSSLLFEVLECNLGNGEWHFCLHNKGRLGFVLSSKKLATDEVFYEQFVEREGDARERFDEWCKTIDMTENNNVCLPEEFETH
ncbi:hypothetical protein FACS1894170_04450 [Planctomycetales bacterium]|nr:hypothetical protein FACS1894170_04450 [Planctomycetales bacterium]